MLWTTTCKSAGNTMWTLIQSNCPRHPFHLFLSKLGTFDCVSLAELLRKYYPSSFSFYNRAGTSTLHGGQLVYDVVTLYLRLYHICPELKNFFCLQFNEARSLNQNNYEYLDSVSHRYPAWGNRTYRENAWNNKLKFLVRRENALWPSILRRYLHICVKCIRTLLSAALFTWFHLSFYKPFHKS